MEGPAVTRRNLGLIPRSLSMDKREDSWSTASLNPFYGTKGRGDLSPRTVKNSSTGITSSGRKNQNDNQDDFEYRTNQFQGFPPGPTHGAGELFCSQATNRSFNSMIQSSGPNDGRKIQYNSQDDSGSGPDQLHPLPNMIPVHSENGQHMQPEGIPSLDEILITQAADGEFHLDELMLRNALGHQCKSLVLEQFLGSMSENNPSAQMNSELRLLRLNIFAVVYITERHATSKGLWELQVAKARQWIKQKMVELWEKGSLEGLPELDMLESLILKELHEKDSRGT